MAGRSRRGVSPFRDNRRDWISDRATRRDDFDRDRSPMRQSRDRDTVWNNDRFDRDGRDDNRWRNRSRSPDIRSRDRSRSSRMSFEREIRRDSSLDRNRYDRGQNRSIQRSRDRSPVRDRLYDNDRSSASRRGREVSLDRFENARRSEGRDQFGRDLSRDHYRMSPERSPQNNRNRNRLSPERPLQNDRSHHRISPERSLQNDRNRSRISSERSFQNDRIRDRINTERSLQDDRKCNKISPVRLLQDDRHFNRISPNRPLKNDRNWDRMSPERSLQDDRNCNRLSPERPLQNDRGHNRMSSERSLLDDRNRNRISPVRPLQDDRIRSPRGRESPVEKFVDNWGRELRLGGDGSRNNRYSPDRGRTNRTRSPEKRQSRDNSRGRERVTRSRERVTRSRERVTRSRERVTRSRERDWKRSVDDFLGSRGNRSNSPINRGRSRDRGNSLVKRGVSRDRGNSPVNRGQSRDKGRDVPSRDSLKRGGKDELEWDRGTRQFERQSSRNEPINKRDDDHDIRLQRQNRQNFQNRKSLDRPNSKDRSRDYSLGGRSRAPAISSPKHNETRDRTPVIDEKSDGEDMVISDDDNNEDENRICIDEQSNLLVNYDKDEQPEKTIVVRRMPPHINEVDIHLDITSCNLVCHDIRLMRRKDNGYSRGFAFVEFNNVVDAATWMELKKRVLRFGKAECTMEYRASKAPSPAPGKFLNDWMCSKCHAHNFSKRFLCYICNVSRKFDDAEIPPVVSSEHPTNTVVLLGLDSSTTEESVLKSIASLTDVPMRSIKIVRDPLTNISKGACYMEMNSILDAYNLFKALNTNIPVIDCVRPVLKYAKPESNQSISRSTIVPPAKAVVAAQWSHHQSATPEKYTLADVPRLAEYSAALYAKTPQEKIAYYSYYQNYYKKQITEGTPINLPMDSAAGLATAQASLASSLTGTPEVTALAEPPDGSGTSTYPMPDTSQYQYDPSSGFYYDPFTTLYYDANSQYYYNSKLSKYLYWDPARKTYLPTPSIAQLPKMFVRNQDEDKAVIVGAPQPATRQDEKKKERENDNDRVKVAKRIAKGMEKWAKTLNQKKETAKQNFTPASSSSAPTRFGPTAGAADIGFAVLERKDHLSTLGNYFDVAPVRHEVQLAAHAMPPAANSDEEEESGEEKSHTDWEKLICLLCKRQLGSKEALIKHQTISELHKQNLAAWYRSRGLDPDDAQMRQNQYRDRASERRQKHFVPDAPKPSRLKESYIKSREAVYEQPTTMGLKSDNVGNKLLQKMGWQEGMGLGKSNQGRTSIIEAKSRSATAGLGSKPSGITRGPGETYKDCVKKMMAIRYAQLEDQ